MPRTILIHLNVTLADDDPRGAEELADSVVWALQLAPIHLGDDGRARLGGLIDPCVPLAEEV